MSFVLSYVLSYILSYVLSFVLSYVLSFVLSYVLSFVLSYVLSFVLSYVLSYVLSFWKVDCYCYAGFINLSKKLDTLKQWHAQYGPIVRERLLGRTMIHVFEPDAFRAVFNSEDKVPLIEPLNVSSSLFRHESGMTPGLGNRYSLMGEQRILF